MANYAYSTKAYYTMSIVKNTPHILKHSGSYFTTILNKTIEAIKNPATLGVYVYLTSKPDNWEISEKNLQNRFGKGRDFIRARIAELKHIGLMESIAYRDAKGMITRWETMLYNEVQTRVKPRCGDEPIQNPENPVTGQTSDLVDPPTTNKRSLKIKDLNKTPIVPKGTTLFNAFWDLYPMKKGKKKALAIWKCENLDTHADVIMEKLKTQVEKDDQWKQGYIPNPSTYLNGERWLDEITKPKPKTQAIQEKNPVVKTEIAPDIRYNGFINDFRLLKRLGHIVKDAEEPKFNRWLEEGSPEVATDYINKYNLKGVSQVSKRP